MANKKCGEWTTNSNPEAILRRASPADPTTTDQLLVDRRKILALRWFG